jgi:hypothetical protein
LHTGDVAQDSSTGGVIGGVTILGTTSGRVAVVGIILVRPGGGRGSSSGGDASANGVVDPPEFSSAAIGSRGEEGIGGRAIGLRQTLRVAARDCAILFAHHILVVHISLVVVSSGMTA